jgi:hypothetical protein
MLHRVFRQAKNKTETTNLKKREGIRAFAFFCFHGEKNKKMEHG